jgi:hypothetical protein
MGNILQFPLPKVKQKNKSDVKQYHSLVDFLLYFQNNLAINDLPTNKDGSVNWTEVSVNTLLTDSVKTILEKKEVENEVSIRLR